MRLFANVYDRANGTFRVSWTTNQGSNIQNRPVFSYCVGLGNDSSCEILQIRVISNIRKFSPAKTSFDYTRHSFVK
jgi:hypothetical protein